MKNDYHMQNYIFSVSPFTPLLLTLLGMLSTISKRSGPCVANENRPSGNTLPLIVVASVDSISLVYDFCWFYWHYCKHQGFAGIPHACLSTVHERHYNIWFVLWKWYNQLFRLYIQLSVLSTISTYLLVSVYWYHWQKYIVQNTTLACFKFLYHNIFVLRFNDRNNYNPLISWVWSNMMWL